MDRANVRKTDKCPHFHTGLRQSQILGEKSICKINRDKGMCYLKKKILKNAPAIFSSHLLEALKVLKKYGYTNGQIEV